MRKNKERKERIEFEKRMRERTRGIKERRKKRGKTDRKKRRNDWRKRKKGMRERNVVKNERWIAGKREEEKKSDVMGKKEE